MTPLIVSIEGNIGAGKSTILEIIQKEYGITQNGVVFLKEPVDEWYKIKDNNGRTMLENFYADPHKNAFAFQVMACTTRTAMIKQALINNKDCKLILCERSIEADAKIFAKMLFDDKLMNELEYQIYQLLYKENHKMYPSDGFIYINTGADKCYERVKKRDRTGEDNISIQYLRRCEEYHHQWFLKDRIQDPILFLDTSEDIDLNDSTQYEKWSNQICDFIDRLSSIKMNSS